MSPKLSTRFELFATSLDYENLMSEVENQVDVKYVLSCNESVPTVLVFESYKQIPNLGVALTTNRNLEKYYLILPRVQEVVVNNAQYKTEPMRYIVDVGGNTNAVIFRPAGRYDDTLMVAGHLSCPYGPSPFALDVFDKFSKIIKKKYKYIDGFRIGPDAYALGASRPDVRFTEDASRPIEGDVKIPHV